MLGRWPGYVNFTKVIYGIGSQIPERSAHSDRLIKASSSLANRARVQKYSIQYDVIVAVEYST